MKNLLFKSCLMATMALAAVSCDDDVSLGSVDTGKLDVPTGNVVYITSADGQRLFSSIDFANTATSELVVHSPKNNTECTVTFSYDAEALTNYNSANETDFPALPESVVSFANGGVASISAGATEASVDFTLTSPGNLDPNTTYALPIRATISGNAQLGELDATHIIFVRDITGLPTATKYITNSDGQLVEGIKMFNCIEVNGTNPLNTMVFTLQGSGKPLFDAVILFSSNINYDATTKKVYVYNNENVQAVLDNYDKYLKPLKERGIKVILSILGNHDRAGVANLSDANAKIFAQEVKAMCDEYNLDGVMLDDEYSDYSQVWPGFVSPGVKPLSRLYYELKKAMPDRWMVTYAYGSAIRMESVTDLETGVTATPSDFIDFAFANYPDTPQSNPISSRYGGLDKKRIGYCSMEFAQGQLWSQGNDLKTIQIDGGYGCQLIFACGPDNTNLDTAKGMLRVDALKRCAKTYYNADLVWDGTSYAKDW
ncbi:MAG: DUF1735 domain-containing protein [Firmicutes bacterium]|nr:DUF1735 domain-containing protein [Bacillota bacterium]MCM1400746.1 DUF1735 domain-containing protein [Bacteroides sp.]MCM1476835.1 DUF1735 domain-containing protein [Bacteroides sp.]